MAQRNINLPVNRKIIGSFEYYEDKVLGKGSNSVAYEGKKIGTNQPVCIKKIALRSPLVQKLAKTQIEVLKRVTHKNIIRFISSIERGSFIYIVTQLCDMTLSTKLKKDGGFDDKLGLETFLQILEGYQQLRNNGYIHRDIKPQNLLISGNIIRLADFGYSTVLRSQSFRENFNVGTPLYMSPQTLHNNNYSQKSDIWSLGVTLYEIMSGRNPFTSKEELSLKRQLKKPIKQLACHPKIMKIIKKCLQYDPLHRFDLQTLILQVKLVISELNQRAMHPSEKNLRIWDNELSYIEFLEYVILLAQKCQKLSESIKQRCIFLIEHNIRMRIDFLETKIAKSQNTFPSSSIRQRYLKLKELHSSQIHFPERIQENDRLHFFKNGNSGLNQSLQWQTQAQLKCLTNKLLSQLTNIRDEHSVIRSECKVKLVDFLLTAFLLNRMLIEKENDADYFLKQSQLEVMMKSPCRVSFKTLQKIKAKALLLRIM